MEATPNGGHLINRWGSGTAASFSFNIKDASVNLSTRQEAFGNTCARTDNILTVGEWQHVAVSFDNEIARIYLNGELRLTEPGMHVPQDTNQILTLGREASFFGYFFRGQMDEGEGDVAFDAAGTHDMQLGNTVETDTGDPAWVKEPSKR